jgi:subtilisin family serine protease
VSPRGGYVEGQLLVKLLDSPAKSQIAISPHDIVGATVLRRFSAIGWEHVRLPEGMGVSEGIRAYLALPGVLAAEPNYTLEPAATPNDPQFVSQWGPQKIGAIKAWDTTTGSSNVVVAVIDSGVDYNHPDLAANIWHNPGETGLDANGHDKASNGIDDDGDGYVDDVYGISFWNHDSNPMDLDGHGTACASIIGAVGNNHLGLAGLNWNVQIMPLVFWSQNHLFLSGVLENFEYVIQQRRRGVNVRVTNNSYGKPFYTQAMKDAIDIAGAEGVLTVCAAGNYGLSNDSWAFAPASLDSPYIISVAASDSSDFLADFSNFGRSSVDLAAPGVGIVTAATNSGYISDFTGTSAACPHVAGAAALLLAVKPDATPLELKAALMQSVDQGAAFRGQVASNGRLNVFRALQVITNTSLPPVIVGAFPGSILTRQDSLIELWFNRPMDRASVEAALQIVPAVAGSFEWSDEDRVVRLRPSTPLLRTNYTARLLGTAHDLTGNKIDGNFNRTSEGSPADDFVWSFGFRAQNDDFANARVLSGTTGFLSDDTSSASQEPDEPFQSQYNRFLSLWYEWTAPQDGWVTFDTSSSSLDTIVAAYTGSALASLVESAFNDDYGTGTGGRISFPVIAGTNYFITVASEIDRASWIGSFTLKWYPTPTPAIFRVSPTIGSPGTKVTLFGTNLTGATAVLFNSASAVFTNALTNKLDLVITATVPPDATDGPITIRTPHGDVTTPNSFVVLRPRLLAHPTSSGSIEISWADPSTNITLEAVTNLGTGLWAPVTGPFIQTNGYTVFQPDVSLGNRFYRLRKQ